MNLIDIVQKCDDIMSHAWMVRTFVKHSEEAEDSPELMELPRIVFDVTRALETRVQDPVAYLKMLSKKISKLRNAAAQFAVDAPKISVHTNFAMAARSMTICVRELEGLLAAGQALLTQLPSTDDSATAPHDDE